MAEASAGIVTVLFTDLVGSTALRERVGEDTMEELRRDHFDLLRGAATTRGGREVKNVGDGLMVVFTSALDALASAVAMQQAVHERNEQEGNDDRRLGVRIGMEAGEPVQERGDYFGTPVVIASRLCDRAQGGQIFTSELVRRLVGSRGGHSFGEPEPAELKGITEPVSVYELHWTPAEKRAAGQTTTAAEPPPRPPLPALIDRAADAGFIGRESELAVLRRQLERAVSGRPRLVLLAGEPGIGKTRLAAEFARVAYGEGAAVLFGRACEGAPIAYEPFADALRGYASSLSVEELRRHVASFREELLWLAPEIAERLTAPQEPPQGEDGERTHRLAVAFSSFLADISKRAPVVLVLDDLQCADEPTLAVLKQIVRAPELSGLLIIGTYRHTEIARSHPLAKALADLRRDRAFERIELEGLDEAEVARLIDARAGEGAPAELATKLHQRTEGNPFFIEEVLLHLSETGAITQREGRVDAAPRGREDALPEGIKEVIGHRLARLSDDCNSVLTIASVIGRKFDLEALERASDLSSDRLLVALEEAVRARAIDEEPHVTACYNFSQALIHEALYDDLTTTRRVRLHGQTLRYADSNGVKLAYEVLGASGPYLIGVGLSSCPAVRTRNWATTQKWDRLAAMCRVILYDRRGVGFSSAPDRGYSFFASLEDLRAVLDCVGVERVVLWGATDGGPLAIAFAAQYPERVAGLILLGTTAKYTNSPDYALGVNQAALEALQRTEPVDQGRAVSQFVTRTRPDSDGADEIGEVVRRVPRRVWSKVSGGIGAGDARSLLGRVRAPTLIFHDPGNTYIPVEAAQYLHEGIRNSELDVTEEYRPGLGESVFRRLEAFIGRVAGRMEV